MFGQINSHSYRDRKINNKSSVISIEIICENLETWEWKIRHREKQLFNKNYTNKSYKYLNHSKPDILLYLVRFPNHVLLNKIIYICQILVG